MKKIILISLAFGLIFSAIVEARGGRVRVRGGNGGFFDLLFLSSSSSTETTGTRRGTVRRRMADVKSQMEENQRTFVTENQDRLEQELAQGQGEGLQVLSALFGCSEGAQAEFAKATQREFSTMFGEGQTNVGVILSTLRGTVTTNPRLAQSCSYTTA